MNHWNRLLAAAVCLCLLLCACTGEASPEETQAPSADERQEEPAGIVTDAGQAETVQDYYDRTAIISRNERIRGSFVQTQSWAMEYAALRYPDADCQVRYISGYQAPDAMFRDELRAGVACWDISVGDDAEEEPMERVQIFYFSEMADDEQTQCFSGLLAGEACLSSRPEAYAYLMLDPRFSGRMQKLSQPEAPAGAEVFELTAAADDPVSCTGWMLSETAAAVLTYGRDGSCTLRLLSTDGSFPEEVQTLEGIWNGGETESGRLTLEQTAADGTRRCLEIRLEDGVPSTRAFSAPAEEESVVGPYTVTWQEGSLYLGEELLLEGGAADPEDDTTFRSYQFVQALDDHRFVYSLAGWEWVEGCGVYDLTTRTATPIGDWGFALLIIRAEAGAALGAHLTEPGSWDFSLVDLETLELTPLFLGYGTEEEAFSGELTANDDLSLLALAETDWETGDHRITVRNMTDGRELFRWELDGSLVAGSPQIRLAGENTLCVILRRWDTDTYWLYRIRF